MVAVSIDLRTLEQRIRRRHELLADLADELMASGFFDPSEILLDERNLIDVVEAYFLLSEAYKAERLPAQGMSEAHLTEPPKIAAMTAVAIMMFKPFRRADGLAAVRQPHTRIANQVFAMSCAASFVENDFGSLSFEMSRRLYNYLQWVSSSALAGYFADRLEGHREDIYTVNLAASGFTSSSGIVMGLPNFDHRASDLPMIDMLVVFFEQFWQRPGTATV